MTCDTCGTITRYGKRVPSGRMMCIDCWKLKPGKPKDSDDEKKNKSSKGES